MNNYVRMFDLSLFFFRFDVKPACKKDSSEHLSVWAFKNISMKACTGLWAREHKRKLAAMQ